MLLSERTVAEAGTPTSPSNSDPLIGSIVGERYRIVARIGKGGMGTVYRAEHTLMGKTFAVKVLRPEVAIVPEVMARFEREALALAKIAHPNVVNATDFGRLSDGSYFLVLEHIQGTSLARALRRGPFPAEQVVTTALQICRALAAAHSQGIIHRDLKPDNVMLMQDGEGQTLIKVLDFGMAKLHPQVPPPEALDENRSSITRAGAVFGTPHYMAPEQVASLPVDGRTDLYALGVICHEMLTGERPFQAGDVRELLAKHLHEPPPALPANAPPALRSLIERLMAKNADERPAGADEVVDELSRFLAARHGSGEPRRGAAIASVALLLLTLGAGVLILQRGEQAPEISEAPERTFVDADLLSRAEFGEQNAIDELAKIPPPTRSRAAWLALGSGLMKQKQTQKALETYEHAITTLPELADEQSIVEHVMLATTAPSSAEDALRVAAHSLGSRGVDILFAVWSSTSKRTKLTALADHYLRDPAVRRKGSAAAKVALALRDNPSCRDLPELLERAQAAADVRSLLPLRQLERQRQECEARGAAAGATVPCPNCPKDAQSLKRAIANASGRPAPDL